MSVNMSRQSHLPPRSPFRKNLISIRTQDSHSQNTKTLSQGSILEENPAWFYNLLDDKNTNSYEIFHRRSASDSVTLLNTSAYPPSSHSNEEHTKTLSWGSILEENPAWLNDLLDDENTNSYEAFHRRSASDSVTLLNTSVYPSSSHNNEDNTVENETCYRLESTYVYGPNSPRQRSNINFSENATSSALSDFALKNHLQYIDDSLSISAIRSSGLKGDAGSSNGELSAEINTTKRYPGQRSRVRKLKYISELERTVDFLTNLESELAADIASLLQQRLALSIENSRLKQQLARLHQKKLIMESEYKCLNREAERLKAGLANQRNGKVRTNFGHPVLLETGGSKGRCQMLDMAKLNLK
ncbi:hypothetical protein K2173_024194 [Erythroxylum novogranatense]|uniref:Uncharacterized protein n=1 Tax=Erythroxylum novogranatense TaxID=1862640 RepID=A0AAV8UCE8_9ROSI|nr:hypothetical protein K2173_024194 [Erythroxylum novogranatense]